MNVGSYNGDEKTSTAAEFSALKPGDKALLTADANHTVYIGYDFYGIDNPLFHRAGKYGYTESRDFLVSTPESYLNLSFF
jgi:hypothetical protein